MMHCRAASTAAGALSKEQHPTTSLTHSRLPEQHTLTMLQNAGVLTQCGVCYSTVIQHTVHSCWTGSFFNSMSQFCLLVPKGQMSCIAELSGTQCMLGRLLCPYWGGGGGGKGYTAAVKSDQRISL